MKKEGKKLTWGTAYDYPTSRFAQNAGIDMILVGGSQRSRRIRIRRDDPGDRGRVHNTLQGGSQRGR